MAEVQQEQGYFEGARNLEFHLLAVPDAPKSRQVQDKVYELECKATSTPHKANN